MQMNAYLSFSGECEAAFEFYEECLDGKLGEIFRYAGTPMSEQVPPGWQNKVMHDSVAIGEHVVMGGDVAPDRYEKPKGISRRRSGPVRDAKMSQRLKARNEPTTLSP